MKSFLVLCGHLFLQVTIPMGFQDKSPVSVSFIARHGGDRFLLDTTKLMHASLQEQAEAAGKSNLSSNVVSREASAEIAKEKVWHHFLLI